MPWPLASITSGQDADADDNSNNNNVNTRVEGQIGPASTTANAADSLQASRSGVGVASFVKQPTERSQTDREDAQVFDVVRRDLLLGP